MYVDVHMKNMHGIDIINI